jgi:hypothetical protein
MNAFLIIGLVISIIGMFTSKAVAEWIAPKKEGVSAIPRTLLSVFWLVGGPFVSLIFALGFALGLALLN